MCPNGDDDNEKSMFRMTKYDYKGINLKIKRIKKIKELDV